jgi:hypothetical protein
MFTHEEVRTLTDATAYDQAGQKVGQGPTIYQDRETGEPEWLTVKTGPFGMKETFVSLGLARPAAIIRYRAGARMPLLVPAPLPSPDRRGH